VNVNEKKLVIEGDCLLTADLDLSGLQILWNIALLSQEEGIANMAVDSLRTLFLNLSEGLQASISPFLPACWHSIIVLCASWFVSS
jgi:hypothetical protein